MRSISGLIAVLALTAASVRAGYADEDEVARKLEGRLSGNERKATIKSIEERDDKLVIKVELRHRQVWEKKVAGHKFRHIGYSNTVDRTFEISGPDDHTPLDLGLGATMEAGPLWEAYY